MLSFGQHLNGQTLLLSFGTKSIRAVCENEDHARSELGPAVAETLKRRLADLEAATSIKDLLVGNPRILAGSSGKEMTLDLRDGFQIVFSANHPKNPVTEENNLDWDKVIRIKILRIGN